MQCPLYLRREEHSTNYTSIHTTSPAKRRLENSTVRFEREIREQVKVYNCSLSLELADFEKGSIYYEPRSGVTS